MDTTVIVADQKLFVHKNVLIGVSNEFRDQFREKQSSNAKNDDITVIEFPKETSVEVAKAFIKVCRTKDNSRIKYILMIGNY